MSKKCEIGYIKNIKIKRWLNTIIFLLIIIALFTTGLLLTHNRLNWFTFASVLLCLPFAKYLVSAIIITPFKSVSSETEEIARNICGILPLYFELIFNDDKNFYYSDIMCIMNHNIIIYTSKTNSNLSKFEKHIINALNQSNHKSYTVKVWNDITKFKSRLEEMEISAQDNSYLPTKEHIEIIEMFKGITL